MAQPLVIAQHTTHLPAYRENTTYVYKRQTGPPVSSELIVSLYSDEKLTRQPSRQRWHF